MQIRTAGPVDWPGIYPIFRAVVAAGETYAYPPDLELAEAASWWLEPLPGRTLVATEQDRVLGTAKFGPNRPGRGSHVATASFMVAEDARGGGVGRALGQEVLRLVRNEGYRAVQFNAVVETNAAAVGLWRSLGFGVVGTVPAAFDHPRYGFVGLHVMHLAL